MINGIINVYKEAGFTSFDVVAKLRGITRIRKIGHTGTLDPDATGVLPVCVGSATKLCDMLTDKTKEYEATFRLGITTDTQDISGKVLIRNTVDITRERLEECIMSFVGKQQQIPPMYSAIKINGQKLYDLARAGKEVERQPRDIEISKIEILKITGVEAVIRVGCSKGTYIRTLCHDIGQKLGCGATMTKLVRIRSGQFCIEEALTLSQIERIFKGEEQSGGPVPDIKECEARLAPYVVPVDRVFEQSVAVTVSGEDEKRVLNGNFLTMDYQGDRIRVYLSEGTFAAVYDYNKEKKVYKPYKMFLQ